MKKVILLVILLSLFALNIYSDEIEIKEKNPWLAGALSLGLPGGGQAYNNAWIKFGAVVAIEGTFAGLALYHNDRSNHYYDKYKITLDESDYDKYSDYYYKKQSDLWWLGITIFVSTIDAYVDAHLYNYDLEKKKIHMMFDGKTVGLSYKF